MLGNLVRDIRSVEVSLTNRRAHVVPRSLVICETLVPLVLRSTEIAKCVQNQSGPDGLPIILAQSLFSTRQTVQKKRVALFKLALRKKSPAQICLPRPSDVVTESLNESVALL